MLHVTTEQSGENVILHCVGKIVRGHEAAILCSAVRQQGRKVILELSKVRSIDANGLRGLISLQAAGVYLQLLNPTHAIREVLRATKLESIFEVCMAPLAGNGKDGSRQASRALSPAIATAG